jgi:hypothetical protein
MKCDIYTVFLLLSGLLIALTLHSLLQLVMPSLVAGVILSAIAVTLVFRVVEL